MRVYVHKAVIVFSKQKNLGKDKADQMHLKDNEHLCEMTYFSSVYIKPSTTVQ